MLSGDSPPVRPVARGQRPLEQRARDEAMKEYLRQHGIGYLVALGAAAAMVLLRWLLDRGMGYYLPFITLYGAVAAAVWYGGYRPALVATTLGYVACNYLF